MPRRQWHRRQQPSGKWSGVDEPDGMRFRERQQPQRHSVLKRVMVVGDRAIDQACRYHPFKILHRVPADPDVANFSLLDLSGQSGERFIDDLLDIPVLNIVAENDIEGIEPHAFKGNVDTFRDPLGGEIEMLRCVATEFRADNNLIARDLGKDLSEQNFAHPAPVVRSGIDKIDPSIECCSNRGERRG